MRVLIAFVVLAGFVLGSTGSCTQNFERYQFEAGGAAGLPGDSATPLEPAASGGAPAEPLSSGDN